ncbi:MAG: 16S rRNA (adenine(1518)-N(6)/adenine(1519)-N(6))-dimethyltransferase RsmA [Puniceicoccales bacterium]|jgi:16S rRNA (adenine1518-N6/adenine1519-N6)-dimethyltransferase|nr:16S rRNA (adenine(1518)-N(6)/adenine(1519)-N(6))-dimethyltransferase RsmA [Puniceicoccales bacterium]
MASLFGWTRHNLENLRIHPSRRLGQNFLIDGNIVDKLVAVAGVGQCDNVIEVGAGLGAISDKILRGGANLFATEIDRRLFDFLETRFANCTNFHVRCADAVKFPLAGLPEEVSNCKVVANLPYAISSPWLGAILSCGKLPDSMVLIVQDEVAQRFLGKENSDKICPLAIFLQSAYGGACVHKISSSSFYPKPAVASTIVKLTKNDNPFLFGAEAKRAIGEIFTRRRKQIAWATKGKCAAVRTWVLEHGISTNLRPEEISLAQWQQLNKFF